MTALPECLFADPVWPALQTTHRHLAITLGDAARYRPEVAPFAALAMPTLTALRHLHDLLTPGETVWLPGLRGVDLQAGRLILKTTLDCLQMVLPESVSVPETGPRDPQILALANADAPEMVALTDLAFPGFFRARTCEMGTYLGIRQSGALVAMGGERLRFPGYSEISGVCTHPDHRGKGYAAELIWEVVRRHRRERTASWLHVAAANRQAIALYLKLGFETVRVIPLFQIERSPK